MIDSDENGASRPGKVTQRYSWFGGRQRSSETLTGTVLMGARLHDPKTARFLQLDPVFGGNCNAYEFVCAVRANRIRYRKFGPRHIKDRHVGYGKRDNRLAGSTMLRDLKKTLTSGRWTLEWVGVHNGSFKVTYPYWTGCGCRKRRKYVVTAYHRTTRAPDGKPLGVTTTYRHRKY